jgi:hypothetical protein
MRGTDRVRTPPVKTLHVRAFSSRGEGESVKGEQLEEDTRNTTSFARNLGLKDRASEKENRYNWLRMFIIDDNSLFP